MNKDKQSTHTFNMDGSTKDKHSPLHSPDRRGRKSNLEHQISINHQLCHTCLGSGCYNLNGTIYPCVCVTDKENILSRTFNKVDCSACSGKGYIDSYKHPGHKKICMECVRLSGYCPKCFNTGIKIINGKQCKCKSNSNKL